VTSSYVSKLSVLKMSSVVGFVTSVMRIPLFCDIFEYIVIFIFFCLLFVKEAVNV